METINLILTALIVPILTTAIAEIVKLLFNEVGSDKKRMETFLNDVLIPLLEILHNKAASDITQDTINELLEIHEKHILLIPREMHYKFKELKDQFDVNKKLDGGTYKRYYKYLDLTLLHTKKVLKFPKPNKWVYFQTMPLWHQLFFVIWFPIYLYLSIKYALQDNINVISILIGISAVIIFILSISDLYFANYRLKRRKKKKVTEEATHTDQEHI